MRSRALFDFLKSEIVLKNVRKLSSCNPVAGFKVFLIESVSVPQTYLYLMALPNFMATKPSFALAKNSALM